MNAPSSSEVSASRYLSWIGLPCAAARSTESRRLSSAVVICSAHANGVCGLGTWGETLTVMRKFLLPLSRLRCHAFMPRSMMPRRSSSVSPGSPHMK